MRAILEEVNALPEQTPTPEPGVSVQIAEGTLKTSNGSATANCGFQPDAVEIMIVTHSDGEDGAYAAIFTKSNRSKYASVWRDGNYPNGFASIHRSSNGFSISGMNWYSDDWVKQVDSGNTYSYVAIKYT